MNVSSHKRKTSGIPLEAEAVVRRDSRIFVDSLGQIADDEEEQLAAMHDLTEENNHWSNTSGSSAFAFDSVGSIARNVLSTPKNASLLFVGTLILLYLFSNSTTVNQNELPAAASIDEVQAPKDMSKSDITYGEEHMEVVGAPKESHVHEFNKILFYDSPSIMEKLHSKGPIQLNDNKGGLHLYENVCLTNNVDKRGEQDLRGLIYFNDKVRGEKRCVPCETATNTEDQVVKHECGMTGLSTMFASSVDDWTQCIGQKNNLQLMQDFKQTQSPLSVDSIHMFKEPTFLLQFNALNTETALFDMLMTYLPHWDQFRGEWDFPFDAVISHSLQGCLSHSHHWFCEVLHQMNAFGPAKEIPWEPDDSTLYCFEALIYNEVGYQRDLNDDTFVNREILGEFREILFRKFALPRRRTVEDRLEEAKALAGMTSDEKEREGIDIGSLGGKPKIIFYDNTLGQQMRWNEMKPLIDKARSYEKYKNVTFVTVNDFGTLTVAQQARTFNEADAVVMVHGEHMANAIFAVDGTVFIEVGCKVKSLIGNARFMDMIDGSYTTVEKCKGDKNDTCVICEGDSSGADFTMTPIVFEKLIDSVVQKLNA